MSEKSIHDLVRIMATGYSPVPPWSRVRMRATFEDRLATRRAPFARLLWIEMAIYAGAGVALATLGLWAILT